MVTSNGNLDHLTLPSVETLSGQVDVHAMTGAVTKQASAILEVDSPVAFTPLSPQRRTFEAHPKESDHQKFVIGLHRKTAAEDGVLKGD